MANLEGFSRIRIDKPYHEDSNLLARIGSTVVMDVAGILPEPIVGEFPQDILLESKLDKKTQRLIERLVLLSSKRNVEYAFWKINFNDGRVIYTKPYTADLLYGVDSDLSLQKELSEIRKGDPTRRENIESLELFHTHPSNAPLSEGEGDIENNWNRVFKYNVKTHVYAISVDKSPKGRILFHYVNSPSCVRSF